MPASTTGGAASPFHLLREDITVALNRARQKNHVSSRIPALIHPLFRNQGGFNFQLLRAIELQAQQLDVLRNELTSAQQASRSEVADLRAALVDSLSQIKALQAETTEQVDALHDILKQQQSAIERHAQQADALQSEVAGIQQARRREVADLRATLVDGLNQIKALADNLNQIKSSQAETSRQVSGVHEILKEQQAQHAATHQQIRRLDGRLADLAMPKITSLDADAFYLAFENQFRGSRADIKERQRIYLPYLAEAGVGTADRRILDLGCGRGEWLELLRENGYTARGVDTNVSMLSLCRELGLDVEQADALACLRSLPANSQGTVTGFHIIEHLPFPVILELFAESYRVLRPGGTAIFETPNPQNLIVGACNFYFDPTHLHPLPPELVQFSFLQIGFTRTELKKLHPYPVVPSHQAKDDIEAEILGFLRREQDFAFIGHK
jgi:O-antigen chain-terminating methyltransferase